MTEQESNLKNFIDLLSSKGLNEEQQKKVLESLNSAIALRLVGLLRAQLTEEKKAQLFEVSLEDKEELVKFFMENLSPDQVKEALAGATEVVIQKFLEKI